MEKAIKECTKPHALAHSVGGVGIGLLAIALVPALATNALIIGAVLLIGAVVWDLSVNKPK